MAGFWLLVLEALRDIAFFLWFVVIVSQWIVGFGYLGHRVWSRWDRGEWGRWRALLTLAALVLGLALYIAVFHASYVYFLGFDGPSMSWIYLFTLGVVGLVIDVFINAFSHTGSLRRRTPGSKVRRRKR